MKWMIVFIYFSVTANKDFANQQKNKSFAGMKTFDLKQIPFFSGTDNLKKKAKEKGMDRQDNFAMKTAKKQSAKKNNIKKEDWFKNSAKHMKNDVKEFYREYKEETCSIENIYNDYMCEEQGENVIKEIIINLIPRPEKIRFDIKKITLHYHRKKILYWRYEIVLEKIIEETIDNKMLHPSAKVVFAEYERKPRMVWEQTRAASFWHHSEHEYRQKGWDNKKTKEGGIILTEEAFIWQEPELTDNLSCSLLKEECIDRENKNIDGVQVSLPCWKKKQTYSCSSSSEGTCLPYREKGCEEIDYKCLDYVDGKCILFSRVMHCLDDIKDNCENLEKKCKFLNKSCTKRKDHICYVLEKKYGCNLVNKAELPECLDGNCKGKKEKPNHDMGSAFAGLNILSGITEDINSDNPEIFPGKAHTCRINMVDFGDCCNDKGWGKALSYTCKEKERDLMNLRRKGLCVAIGSYCSIKVPVTNICAQRMHAFCCFDDKIHKVIQDGGKRQLGMGFGNARRPNCAGLTIEQIERINFEKLDLREVENEFMKKMNFVDMDVVKDKIINHIGEMKDDFDNKLMNENQNIIEELP